MEDFSYSLNEAKPKHFGLEMFAVVLLVSWSLPCLLPCSFPVGLLPTGLQFARSIPVTRRAEAVTHQGTWIYPFVIFVLKFFCVEKKSQCFLRSLRQELCSWWQWAETPLSAWERSVLCCIPAAGRDVAVFVWHRAFPLPPAAVQRRILSLCCTTLKSWAHLQCPQPRFAQGFKLL